MAYREFLDANGAAWTVWDTYPGSAQRAGLNALQGGWLTFESGSERRRLVPAPIGWVEESDRRLCDWLSSAVPARSKLESGAAELGAPVTEPEFVLRRAGEIRDPQPVDSRVLIERSRATLRDIMRTIEPRPDAFGEGPDPRGSPSFRGDR